MTEELDILKIVIEDPSISQRKIAEQTGISLGQVNFLIKKCVKKGLIKIEGQTSKSLKYNLTPKGLAEKAALTLKYVKISYSAVIALTDKIKELADQYEVQGKKIYVYGDQDEMMGICKLALGNQAIYINNDVESVKLGSASVVFYWEENEQTDKLIEGVEAVNLLL